MADLKGDKLKQSFKEQLLKALGMIKNAYATITFKFSEEESNYNFPDVKIDYMGGTLIFKDVMLGSVKDSYVIDIILDNMHYDCFSFIRSDYQHGEPRCQGFGESWGTDTITIIYHRFHK